MKTLNLIISLLVIANATATHTQAAKPQSKAQIVKETLIFKLDESRDIRENRGMHSMRLSPDGKKLLYVQRVKAANEEARGGYQLVLRDIKSGKDTVMPGAPSGSDDFLVACVSMLPFDAKGKKLVIPIGAGTEPARPGKGTMQLGVYDVKSGKVDKLDLSGPVIFPTYDATGENLIVFVMARGERGPDLASSKIVVSPAKNVKFRKIGIMGLTRSPCPGADILPILLAPVRGNPAESNEPRFVLYDTKNDKHVSAPTVQSGSKLDDHNPQWTADGRFMYYVDREKDANPDGTSRYKSIVRIWDRKKNVEHAVIQDMIPVGPAPGKSAMILLNSKERKYVIDDPSSLKSVTLSDDKIRLISAAGGFIVYAKEDENGAEQVFRAEIKKTGK